MGFTFYHGGEKQHIFKKSVSKSYGKIKYTRCYGENKKIEQIK